MIQRAKIQKELEEVRADLAEWENQKETTAETFRDSHM